jgi:aminobenzoyl-glutamate transport protein
MFMQVGISPELTQAAYRIGDSASNVIAPLNPYIIIVLAMMQKYARNTGIGSLVSIMLPYTVVFSVVWTALLVIWMISGAELGPAGPLVYIPGR